MGGETQNDMAGGLWHLDKRVPIVIIVTILFQTMGVVWWAATTSVRVEALTEIVAELASENNASRREREALRLEIAAQRQQDAVTVEQLRASNEAITNLRTDVGATNALLERLIDNLVRPQQPGG